MRKKLIVGCFLLACLMAFGGLASANTPYASILAYNQNAYNVGALGPNMNVINTLNIINLTPWEIYFGEANAPYGVDILNGFDGPAPGLKTDGSYPTITTTPFWLKGINPVVDSSKPSSPSNLNRGFAFHSLQIGLKNPNNEWIQATTCNTAQASSQSNTCYNSFDLTTKASAPSTQEPSWAWYLAQTGYLSVPIVFNSSSGTQGGNTAALNFMVTSSNGFAAVQTNSLSKYSYVPASALSFGDGNNNYAWSTQAVYNGKYDGNPAQTQAYNVSQFLTIQSTGSNANNWSPVPTSSGGTSTPAYLNTAALAYPAFSTLSGVTAIAGQEYDLVVMLQSGDFANLSLIFLATPISPSSAVKRK